jgi:hypothetical protein
MQLRAPVQLVAVAAVYSGLVLLLVQVAGVSAQYLTTSELAQQSSCYFFSGSTSTVANAPVGGFPDGMFGANVYTSSLQSSNLRLRCLEVFFIRSANINDSYAATCLNHAWTLHVCTVNVATGAESCNVTMNSAFIYNASSRPASWSFGDSYFSPGYTAQLRIRWLPNATMPTNCYPMFFTTVAVVENNTPGSTSSLATVIIFVIIAGIVLVILVFFGRYQLRKVLSKFGKKVSTKPRKADFDGIERDVPTAHNNYYDDEQDDKATTGIPMEATEEEFRAQYGAHAIRAHGLQQAELVDGVKITARPMIQPWYERNSFVSPHANRKSGVERYATQPVQPNGAAPIAMQVAHIMGPDGGGGSSVRRRQPSPQFSIEGSALQQRQQPPLYVDPSINTSMQYGNQSGLYDEEPALEGPRRLQFASPNQQQQRGGGEYYADEGRGGAFVASPPQYSSRLPQTRTINPYED